MQFAFFMPSVPEGESGLRGARPMAIITLP
jgi:hypothetical protein